MTYVVEEMLSEKEIQARVIALAGEIVPRLSPDTVVISLLKGAFIFAADLLRALAHHDLARLGVGLQTDFMVFSSYGSGTHSRGQVLIKLECQESLAGRDVLLVDDILDSGNTLAFAVQHLRYKKAAQILTCVLLDKPSRRQTNITPDFVGFAVPDRFVVGYGIDYAEKHRELPYIGYVREI